LKSSTFEDDAEVRPEISPAPALYRRRSSGELDPLVEAPEPPLRSNGELGLNRIRLSLRLESRRERFPFTADGHVSPATSFGGGGTDRSTRDSCNSISAAAATAASKGADEEVAPLSNMERERDAEGNPRER
jgi:hypothetical protein